MIPGTEQELAYLPEVPSNQRTVFNHTFIEPIYCPHQELCQLEEGEAEQVSNGQKMNANMQDNASYFRYTSLSICTHIYNIYIHVYV